MAEKSIFTRIIDGDILSHKIYEDDKTLAFLDIFPAVPGHTVIVPKTQVEFVWDLSDDYYQALMATTKKVAKHLQVTLGTKFVGIKVEGAEVPHAHVKIYPFNTVAEYNATQNTSVAPDHENLAKMAEKLKLENA